LSKLDLLTELLLKPELVSELSAVQWDVVVRQGRRANLLASLESRLDKKGLLSAVPDAPRMHFISAQRMVARQEVAMRWEVECIKTALATEGCKITLLKGAAYLIAGFPAAQGRVFSDVDIIVPKSRLSATESALMINGWEGEHHDEYDQRYYRQWMHEIPPMRHVRRGAVIDVHHTILPETARITVDGAALLDEVVPVSGHEKLYVFQPIDMLLHSATHLFHEGELENGLRDLFDLDSLMRHFGQNEEFWLSLVPRAISLGLTRPLYYAIRYTTLLLGTPVPAYVVSAAKVGKPLALVSASMDFCYRRALRPHHVTANLAGAGLARWFLYLRSHWIRMPLHLLAYHLTRKSLLGLAKHNSKPPVDNAKQA